MKRLFSLALLLAIGCSAAFATPVLYNISEVFTVSAYFTGTFLYDSATNSLEQLHGTVSQSTAANLNFDFNSNYGITPALQSDGLGGVTDTVCNGSGLNGYACLYLDIKANAPTTLNNISYLGNPLNRFVNSDIPISGGVSSYSISLASGSAPEPASWFLMLAGLAASGVMGYRRKKDSHRYNSM